MTGGGGGGGGKKWQKKKNQKSKICQTILKSTTTLFDTFKSLLLSADCLEEKRKFSIPLL